MKSKPRSPLLGRYLLMVFGLSFMVFVLSALLTSRILNRVMVAEVPDITGKSVEAARGALRLKHLSMDIAEFRFDAHMQLNQIISQDPKPGQTVKSGRMVRVVVSRGSQTVKLPALTGLTLRDAGLALSEKGVSAGKVSLWYNAEAPKNTVLDQVPAAGQYLPQGSRVDLLVSLGSRPVRWVMPALKGLEFGEVNRIIKFLKLNLQTLRRKPDSTLPANTVVEQRPAAGERVEGGQAVSLLLTQGTQDVQKPGRYVTIRYRLPAGKSSQRLKMILKDDTGLHEIHN
ncbi:MAG: PASTA domain-containing protein, partial [Candidatus Firestonebacteria bacterium]|nr:PASTA domain-containing protein [Candidatus Firestonebacteria bacterium]